MVEVGGSKCFLGETFCRECSRNEASPFSFSADEARPVAVFLAVCEKK
jgi:hypothetical protein